MLLDTASDLIIIADHQGRVTYANQAAQDLGLERESLAGRPLASLFADQARARLLLTRGAPLSEELELKAGEKSFLTLVSLTPLTETGESLAIIRDVTRRKALERQLMHAEKLASVGILAAGVAHEIGNPLSAVSGYAQLLVKDDITGEERREFATAIASQAERISRIIRDLLDYSRPAPTRARPSRSTRPSRPCWACSSPASAWPTATWPSTATWPGTCPWCASTATSCSRWS